MNDYNLALVDDNLDFQLTSCEKMLGVHIDDNLTWTNYFRYVSKKLSSYLWLLFKMFLFVCLFDLILYVPSTIFQL